MIIHKNVLISLSRKLNLPYNGEQDWILEFANKNNIQEYVDLYYSDFLDEKEKYALVALIVASYDDLLYENSDLQHIIWNKIKKILYNKKYNDIIDYWITENNDDVFNITCLMKKLKDEMK